MTLPSFRTPALAVVLAATLAAAAAGAPVPTEDPAAVLDAYLAAWTSGDVSGLETLVADDFRRHAGKGEECASRSDLEQLIAATHGTYRNFELRVEDRFATGDGGAFRGSFYGVHREVSRIVEFDLTSMFRIEDGRIAEEWVLGDNFLVLLGLGYQLTPPGFEVIPGESAEGGTPSAATVGEETGR